MKKTLSAVLIALCLGASAQNDMDALRFSQFNLSGNARFASMGGALGALGGNSGTLSTNPAGMGIYKRSEFTFSPSIQIDQSYASWNTDPARYNERWRFTIPNAAFIGHFSLAKTDSRNEWKGFQVGVALNRTNNFWSNTIIRNVNTNETTFLDVLTKEANYYGNLDDDYYRGLAYDQGFIHFDESTERYYNDLAAGAPVSQKKIIRSGGAVNDLNFSFSGNYGDQLYLGMSIGVPFARYSETTVLTESDQTNGHPNFDQWTLRENLRVNGIGVNLKLGIIYRPIDAIRIGLAIHTPTYYRMSNEFWTRVDGSGISGDINSPTSVYDYSLRTPFRAIASLGFVIGQRALIGLEYDHMNYNSMRLFDPNAELDSWNDVIESSYRSGDVLRAGGEIRFDPVSIRLGYNYFFNPYKTDISINQPIVRQSFSGGLGFNFGNFSLDLAYVLNMSYNENYWAYQSVAFQNPVIESATIKRLNHQAVISLNFRF